MTRLTLTPNSGKLTSPAALDAATQSRGYKMRRRQAALGAATQSRGYKMRRRQATLGAATQSRSYKMRRRQVGLSPLHCVEARSVRGYNDEAPLDDVAASLR